MRTLRSPMVLAAAVIASLTVLTASVFDANTPANAERLHGTMSRQPTKTEVHTAASMQKNIATRLHKRLRNSVSGASPSVDALTKAIATRQELLKKKVNVQISSEDGIATTWEASTQKYPLWIVPKFSLTETTFAIDSHQIQDTITAEKIVDLPAPVDVTLTALEPVEVTKDVVRAHTTGVAKSGYVAVAESLSARVETAFADETAEVQFVPVKQAGKILNQTGIDLGKLELWATGRSNFKGSDYGRISNVRKAFREHVNNTIVAPGETFSFNETLGGPVSQGRGWSMAKVIFNGGDLEYAPGGGICQASTTTYRAALNAGFPILERAAHSLYVTYYAAYGVGIDATIFPGKQDLQFLNDSGNYLLIQSYDDGFEAYVNIYGTPDGRTASLDGPYFASTAPAGLTYNDRPIRGNEILWIHNVRYPDGRNVESKISSQYNKGIPRYVVTEYGKKELHASAAQ